jgi:putative membrane protein
MEFGMVHGFGAIGAIAALGWLFQLLVLAAVVFLVVYAVRSFAKRDSSGSRSYQSEKPQGTSDGARRILDERFARGEISADEYREMKEELRK